MTKAEINARLATPLTASQLKKTPLVELEAMVATAKPKARILTDRVILTPGTAEDVKPTKAGSKRHLLAQALQRGTTIEHLMELLSWNRDTVSSALRTDMKAIGLGVERRTGKYYLLLPEGVKRIPARDATVTKAEALVAACK